MNRAELLEDFGRVITRERKKKLLSQEKLGELSGISQMSIQRIESGNSHGMRIESFFQVAQALNLSLADTFFQLEKEPSSESKSKLWDECESRISELSPVRKKWLSEVMEAILLTQEES